ncbi:MAG: hypothetical protein WDO12_07765 [Pseudomonadota bacterium]
MLAVLLPVLAAADEGALVDAIRAGDYAGVSRLATRATVNAHLPDGSTPLSWAVETQDPRTVRLLLVAGAKPDAVRNVATAPLLLACRAWQCAGARSSARRACRRAPRASRWHRTRWPCAPATHRLRSSNAC